MKYKVGTHTQGDVCLLSAISYQLFLIIYARACAHVSLLEVSAVIRYIGIVFDELDSLIGQIGEA